MKKVFYNSTTDEHRRDVTRSLIGDLSLPAFAYNFKIDRKILVSTMAGAKPFSDSLWEEICSKTGIAASGDDFYQSPLKLRTNMERMQLLDEYLGEQSVEEAATRLSIDPHLIFKYFTYTENLNARHAMKLAALLGLAENYFEVTAILAKKQPAPGAQGYRHRQPARRENRAITDQRAAKLRALIDDFNLNEFCRAFELDSRRVYGVINSGLRMDREMCTQISRSLHLKDDFFDTPITELDLKEIQSVHKEMEAWPLILQIRAIQKKAKGLKPSSGKI